MKRAHAALAGLGGILALVLGVAAEAQVVTSPPPKPPGTFKAEVAKASKQKEATVEKIFTALGPAFTAQLRAGRQVEVPGIGTFRVVRVAEHRDMVGGRPVTTPARSFVEYVPAGDVNGAANSPGAVPAKTVEGYEFRVNPNPTPGIKNEGVRTPGTRIR
jgi:nucleoid DNA-binding protein